MVVVRVREELEAAEPRVHIVAAREMAGFLALSIVLTSMGGCAATRPVGNPAGFPYMEQNTPADSIGGRLKTVRSSWAGSQTGCRLYEADGGYKDQISYRPIPREAKLQQLHLSRGDVVNIAIPDGDEFNGDYTIGPDGTITLPFIKRVKAAGLREEDLASQVRNALVRSRFYNDEQSRVAVRVVRYAAIQIRVKGAVFNTGAHTLNEPRGDKVESELTLLKSGTRKFGDTTIRRTLTAGLRVASGVRPDADISRVGLVRRGKAYVVDLRGAVTGDQFNDPVLEDGDEIVVPTRGCFQPELVRPSQITPRGIRIYVSKIHFGADARYDERIPYGLRLLQAAVVAS